MAWDDFIGFETPWSVAERARDLRNADDGAPAIPWGGMTLVDDTQLVNPQAMTAPSSMAYEGGVFGKLAKLAGLDPASAQALYNDYLNRAGVPVNPGMRELLPAQMLMSEQGDKFSPEVREWFSTVAAPGFEQQADAWMAAKNARSKAADKAWIAPASLIAPMVLGPLSQALGFTSPGVATMMPAFADAGTAGLGVGPGASAGSLGNVITGLVKNPATSRLVGLALNDSSGGHQSLGSPRTSTQSLGSTIVGPQSISGAGTSQVASLGDSVLSQDVPSSSSPTSLSNSVMSVSQPRNVVRRPQIRLTPGFRRGY